MVSAVRCVSPLPGTGEDPVPTGSVVPAVDGEFVLPMVPLQVAS